MNKTLMNINTLNNALTMSSREIAELTGKRHDHVMEDIRKLELFYVETYSPEKSGEYISPAFYKDVTGRTLTCFTLNKDAALDLVTGYSLPHRHAVNKRWQELESKQATPSNQVQLPNFSNPAEAARAWAAEYEAKQQLALENESLKIELDQTHDWSTIKRQEKIHGRRFNWYVLKSYCLEHKIEIREVFDQNYGSVKAYHRSAWYAVFNVII